MPDSRPRFRLFAGPNGSGKTKLFNKLRRGNEIHTEIYVSADRLEAEFKRDLKFNFNAYRVRVDQKEFLDFAATHGLAKRFDANLLKRLRIEGGILKLETMHTRAANASYVAAIVASYLVQRLFTTRQSFCFETVMSETGKIELFRQADKFGYRTYLYYLATSNVQINIDRVATRVRKGGHNVPQPKIRERYVKSLQNLKAAVIAADRSLIFDNSVDYFVVSEIDRTEGRVLLFSPYPAWLKVYFDPENLR